MFKLHAQIGYIGISTLVTICDTYVKSKGWNRFSLHSKVDCNTHTHSPPHTASHTHTCTHMHTQDIVLTMTFRSNRNPLCAFHDLVSLCHPGTTHGIVVPYNVSLLALFMPSAMTPIFFLSAPMEKQNKSMTPSFDTVFHVSNLSLSTTVKLPLYSRF